LTYMVTNQRNEQTHKKEKDTASKELYWVIYLLRHQFLGHFESAPCHEMSLDLGLLPW